PVLILSGLGELDDKIKGLSFGADDFLTKPFEHRELVARIRAIVRRSKGLSQSTVRTGKLLVNLDSRMVAIGDQPVRLTSKEYALLELLSLRKGAMLSKEVLLEHLYGDEEEAELKLRVFVHKLRKKLAEASGGEDYIETVRGLGYTLRDPGERAPRAQGRRGARPRARPSRRAPEPISASSSRVPHFGGGDARRRSRINSAQAPTEKE